ncbi:solute carrier family 13 member 2-like [Electrophorus electricus]|uniref:solute carrier family 13 member 2-like n=1 Tax=Electrophorus electricus TaxID=8005 RepID=UPI0015CFA13F|nr:solute carrier family 13 member 2-like [Electrophorus electricus]
MAVYWCTDCVPLAVTALLPIIFFPLMGIMKSEQVCLLYVNDASMLGLGGLVVAIAVEYWNLHKRLTLCILMLVGVRPALLMAGFMSIAAFLSMFISSIASVTMMLPIIHDVLEYCRKTEDAAKDWEQQQSAPTQSLRMRVAKQDIQFIKLEPSPEEVFRAEQRMLRHQQNNLNLTKGMSLSMCYAASIGGTATLTGAIPNLLLKNQIDKLFPENGDVINYTSWFKFSFLNMLLMLATSYLWLHFMYWGFNVKKSFGCGTNGNSRQAAHQLMRTEYRKLGSFSFAEGCVVVLFLLLVVLWFTRDPGFMPGWAELLFNQERKKAFIEGSQDFALLGHGAEEVTMEPLAAVRGHLRIGQRHPGIHMVYMICMIFMHMICMSCLLLHGQATTIGLHPLYLMVPPTICISFTFMFPVATPTNSITFTYTNLKIMDMVKPGFVLNILGILCTNLAIHTWGVAIFQLNEFPAWAKFNSSSTALPLTSVPPTVPL